ncbi:DUF4123 domain-containing protein [Symbiopectobacterium purcellii]|uniref:DUF4123 domain-containing protein n=1 Tax=Symbiopectobacterium purcellii TaxID=2871826 RepID=A0ABX9AP38_9ENTR|nr:DUF4123 domain-containing protein [Symbiopectobacterium purcellii]QZN96913.1 DUF4123 domain-containing protein [Symbiopectobacterium purcellii]
MKVSEWQTQQSGHLLAIVDGAADPTAVTRFYALSDGEAFPLFAGTAFGDQAALGPWLLSAPSPEFVSGSPASSGFYLVSDQPLAVIRRHWQSLIEVIRDGEAVIFRFADPRIFLPILLAMTANERDAILGPCSGLWIDGHAFTRNAALPSSVPLKAPWFAIHSHHLAALYDENRHAYILRRRFWQVMTTMMERHPDPASTIFPVLRQANIDKLQDDVLDGVVAGTLTVQTGLPLESIRTPLMLTEAELAQIRHWMAQHAELTGVN